MPVTEAGVGLPRLGQYVRRLAALDIINQRLALLRIQMLGVHHGLVPAMPLDAGIVKMRGQLQADFIRHAVKRQHAVVK